MEAKGGNPVINEDVRIPTLCGRCYANCAIRVRRVNDVAVKIEGEPESTMGLEEITRRLNEARRVWEPFGVAGVFLFGSAARGEAHADSDIDLLVDFNRPVTLLEFVRLQRLLGEVLGRRVDLVTRAALKPRLRDRVLAEAVRAA